MSTTIATIKGWLEHSPPVGKYNTDLRGKLLADCGHFVCAKCMSRLSGRGCHLPPGNLIWKDMPAETCDACGVES